MSQRIASLSYLCLSARVILNGTLVSLPLRLLLTVNRMNGLVANFGCDVILCPPGYQGGRFKSTLEPCSKCENPKGTYYGSKGCTPPVVERDVLQDLFQRCNGSSWLRNDFWGTLVDICDWYGVGCDDHGRVTVLNLPFCENIPQEIHLFPNLLALPEGSQEGGGDL